MASKTPVFVLKQTHRDRDTLAAQEIQPQKPTPAERRQLDTMWAIHRAVVESRKIVPEAYVNLRRCSRPSYQRAPWQPLLEDRTGQILRRSGSYREARSNHCDTTSDCSAPHCWLPCEFPIRKRMFHRSVWSQRDARVPPSQFPRKDNDQRSTFALGKAACCHPTPGHMWKCLHTRRFPRTGGASSRPGSSALARLYHPLIAKPGRWQRASRHTHNFALRTTRSAPRRERHRCEKPSPVNLSSPDA